MTRNSGFTLIEILIALAIFVLLASIVIPNFNFWQRQNSLEATAQEVISALRLAQNETIASKNDSSFGVYFETNKFTVFQGTAFYPSSPDNNVHNLNPSLKISDVNLSGNNFLFFDRLTGSAANYGYIKVELVSDPTKNKVIFVDPAGIVSTSGMTPDDSNRKKDSRHTEFSYSQSAQNAGTLSLYFPAAGKTENIDFQSHLNADKSEFSWTGSVSVQGSEQVLKIHTHRLSLTDAIFCIHRDRRYNSKELLISLDGQNLLNYSATGTTTKGTSLWAGEPQNQ